MGNDKERFLYGLSRKISGSGPSECPSTEDISALIDGTIKNENKNKIQKHISSCDTCYEIYTTAFELTGRSRKSSMTIFSTWSVAASIFIAVVSFVIFYKVNVREKIEENDIRDKIVAVPLMKETISEKIPVEKSYKKGEKTKVTAAKPGKVAVPGIHKPAKNLSEEEIVTEETPETPMGYSGRKTAKRSEPSNVQGILKVSNEPLPPVTTGTIGRGEERQDKKVTRRSRKIVKQDRGEGGLIERFSMDEAKKRKKGPNFDCFNKKGSEYLRSPEYGTSLPLEKNMPVISHIVHPREIATFDRDGNTENVIVEVRTNSEGEVEKVCLLAGPRNAAPVIISAVRMWKFSPAGLTPMRFKLELRLNVKGELEVLNKKKSGKVPESSD